MEGKPETRMHSSMREEAIQELHQLEASFEAKVSDEEFEGFMNSMKRIKDIQNSRGVAHLQNVEVQTLNKMDALMYRWALNVQSGTTDFEEFLKEKDCIESLLRQSRGTPAVDSRLGFYEFLTNLIEAPIKKRTL